MPKFSDAPDILDHRLTNENVDKVEYNVEYKTDAEPSSTIKHQNDDKKDDDKVDYTR